MMLVRQVAGAGVRTSMVTSTTFSRGCSVADLTGANAKPLS
jgi:hypothetical protein